MTERATDTVAQVASRVLATYRAAALRQVARGAWSKQEADKRLQPWGAIALLCGGEITGVTDRFDELCPRVFHHEGRTASPPLEITQRFILASDLCSRATWANVLAKARSEAAARADSLRPDTDKEAAARAMSTWRDLDTLARALGLPLRMLCEADAAASAPPERIAA